MVKSTANRPRTNSPSWLETVDGWVRDAAIRRYSLVALAMTLIALIVIIGLATGVLGAITSSLLPSPIAKTVAGIVSALGTSGTGWWFLRRRRRHRLTRIAHRIRR